MLIKPTHHLEQRESRLADAKLDSQAVQGALRCPQQQMNRTQ
jgi:hypothetical protein